jgi:hypothetical protein
MKDSELKYLDLTPPPPPTPDSTLSQFFKWILVPFVIGLLLGTLYTIAFGAEVPKDAVEMFSEPLPCQGGFHRDYDTDGDPSNGYELHTYGSGSRTLIVLEYRPGNDGRFLRATVTIPGKPVQVFTTIDETIQSYPHPCIAVMEAGVEA